MRLEISGIIERGVPNKERVHLIVSQPANLAYYMIMESVLTAPNNILSGGRLAYWFGGGMVRYGDHVILYTRPGTDNAVRRQDGGINHFFYWGLNKTIWNNPQSKAVLFEIQNWSSI
jgi:hypothetical protein